MVLYVECSDKHYEWECVLNVLINTMRWDCVECSDKHYEVELCVECSDKHYEVGIVCRMF